MALTRQAAGVALLLTSFSDVVLAQQRPNILYFQVDNLGFGELGTYGGTSCADPRPAISISSRTKV